MAQLATVLSLGCFDGNLYSRDRDLTRVSKLKEDVPLEEMHTLQLSRNLHLVAHQDAVHGFRPPPLFAVGRRRSQGIAPRWQHQSIRRHGLRCSASEPTAPSSTKQEEEEYYEVLLEKPLGIKFGRGKDGGAYVVASDPRFGETDSRIEIGDKVDKISAVFGPDIWDAKNYGQIIYAIRTRSGKVYLRFKRMFGDTSALNMGSMSDEEKMWKNERAGGNYGWGTRQIQERNYIDRKRMEAERRVLFEEGMVKFNKGNIEEALIDFENVISTETKKYMGDDFSRVSEVGQSAQYNTACCYAMLGQVDAGLEALESSLKQGFDDYRKVRTDPNLEKLRESPAFKKLINQFDEPILNENALKVIRQIFSFGKED